MSSVNSRSSDGGDLKQLQEQFVSLVKQRDVSGLRALLQSMSSDEARSRLYQATNKGFYGVFQPRSSVRTVTLLVDAAVVTDWSSSAAVE